MVLARLIYSFFIEETMWNLNKEIEEAHREHLNEEYHTDLANDFVDSYRDECYSICLDDMWEEFPSLYEGYRNIQFAKYPYIH